ncbi:MAG: precorrin-2 dehydrogenase/sirohydrochlorin ferrochelatase family protein [Candidatus Sumerlaeaceae bacterium]
MPKFYPIAIRLDGELAVVVGGGKVGERKVLGLLSHGARVRLVSPQATEALRKLAIEGKIEWRPKAVSVSDIDGAKLLLLASPDAQLHDELAKAARARCILVNRADAPEDCDFIVPASFVAGNIEVAVFSGGEAPFFAKYLRRRLEMELSHNLAAMGELMSRLREEIKVLPVSQERRAELLNSVLESDVLDVLRDKGMDAALECARALVASLVKDSNW